jgi:peptidoglycan/xylan/chitin deacetylase (PgdA/CDA1 family)
VALTFDDGPSEFTARFLDVLEREHVAATFFLIGEQVRAGRAQVRRALADGDVIGNHTYSHPMMTHLSAAQQRSQLLRTSRVIRQVSGFQPCLWRPPYGDTNVKLQRLARAFGLLTIDWSVDPQDAADVRAPGATTIYHRVVYGNVHDPDPGVRPGTIVLMHDGGGDRRPTLAALPRIIHALRRRGYTFVTIPQLLHIPLLR